MLDAKSGEVRDYSANLPEAGFYTEIMGKYQWLDNGNVLIAESAGGKAFEINPAGKIVWEHLNSIDADLVGVVEEVMRLPPSTAQNLTETRLRACLH